MNPAEAIEAAELAERETDYRNQLARQMYEAGRRDAEATWPAAGPKSPGQPHAVASVTPNWSTAAGVLVAVLTSPAPESATSPARPAKPNRTQSQNRRPGHEVESTRTGRP